MPLIVLYVVPARFGVLDLTVCKRVRSISGDTDRSSPSVDFLKEVADRNRKLVWALYTLICTYFQYWGGGVVATNGRSHRPSVQAPLGEGVLCGVPACDTTAVA